MTVKSNSDTRNGSAEGSFMLPIWIITLITMIGTSFACYAYHGYDLNRQHQVNMAEIAKIESRTAEYSKYLSIIKAAGMEAAATFLNSK